MKNLSIAGVVTADSKIVTFDGKSHLEVTVALNQKNSSEFWVVKDERVNLIIKKGSRVSAAGVPTTKPYQANDGSLKVNNSLYGTVHVLWVPAENNESQDQGQQEAPEVPTQEVKAPVSDTPQTEISPLEDAMIKIDAAKTTKQCGFLYYNVVQKLTDEEDRKIANMALNSRKQSLGFKKAA